MSKIDKLSILGVRSFDNTRSETIQFHTPLTLIVGLNGSGKTTIIECLKYVTTGEQPPNSKGGAFIHDPKLAGEKEVLAQVKLSFRSTEGIKMVATRNLQLTVKKTTRSMKSLESNVLISKGGERRSASSRTTDIDLFMSRSIGVSKAVLDNVIFCHQDESLWPLSTPADLKKRFDELFDAIKYTKAIENIKILAKNQRTALIGFKKDAEKYKVDKQRGERAFAQANQLSEQINEMKEQHTELSAKIQEATERSDEAFTKADRAGVTVGQLNGKRIEERTKQESVDSLRINLQELQETDEELASMLSQYEKQVGDYQRDFNSAKERYSELAEEIEKVRGKVSNKERECGTYEAQKQSYDAKVVSREKLIKETAHSHAIRGYDWDINDERASEFMQLIKKMAREQTAKFDRVRQENREELQVEQKKLNELAEKKSALNSSKESSRQAIASYDRKLSSLQTQLNRTTIDEGGKATLESERNDVQSKLSSFKSENEAAKHSERIKDLDSRIRQLEDQRERLDEEMAEASRQAKESAELDYVQSKLKQQRESLTTMEGAHREKIAGLLGADWDHKTLESRYQTLLSERSSAVNEAEKLLEGVNRESEQARRQVTDTRKAVELKENKMKAAAKRVRDTTSYEPSEYEHELDLCNQQRDIWVKDVTANKQLMEYFDACISMAEKQRKCRTCCRELKGEKDVDLLIKEMRKQKNEQDLSNVKKDLDDLEKEIQGFKNVRPSFDEWKNLGQELPTLKTEHTTLQRKYDEITKRLEGLDFQSQERREALRAVEGISRAVQSITASVNDIATFERQVKDLTAKQKDAGLSRGTDAVQKDQKKVNEEVRTLKTELAKATSDRDRGSKKINALQLQLSEADKKLSQAEWQLKEKKSLQDQMAETSTLANEQREQMKARDEEIQTLVPLQSQAKARYDDAAHRGAEKDRQLQTEVNKINSSLNELKVANEEIMAYIDRDGPKQVERGRAQLAELKAELENWQKEQQKNVRAVKELEEKLRDHDTTKRSIADNQRFRRDLKALEQVREEIKELESRDAEEEQARFSREGQKAHQERQGFMSKQATLAGQMSSKDEEMQRVLAAWDVDFKDAAKNYKEAHIRAETCKACIEDLGRYSGALDKAVLKYHTLKMEEINRIIDELWRETYQGTDVDTIMIRSESENEKSNKSYNYRVCMMKQDTEMDMRGRCSAGQKVLACIIIRLALAECFGVNCGIIALDEPTTNLDRANIAALAKALGKIIEVRKAQKNFQLIVITHDEDFLRYMNCSDHTEWYYRVGRNDRQKSEIVKQSIAEVM